MIDINLLSEHLIKYLKHQLICIQKIQKVTK
jgi:hypothetical protein